MKTYFIAALLFASITQADIIKCNFTEPFVNTTYSMTQSTLTYKNSDGQSKVVRNVSFQIKSAGVFELVSKEGTVLQTLNLNYQGSDGMSDRLYPYDVKDTTTSTHEGRGGCASNNLK